MSGTQAPDRSGKVLSFRVGTMRLAVATDEVAQVVRSPKVTRVPHAPGSLLGVASLRGAVVPVLSLSRLLGQEADALAATGRVILLDRLPPLGLAVDEVTGFAAFDDPSATHARGKSQLFVDENESRRLIDLDSLLARDFAPRRREAVAERAPAPPAALPDAGAVPEIGLLGFELAGQEYALPLEHVREVMSLPPEIVAMPRLDDALVGIAAYRGAVLPLASLAVLLGLPTSADPKSARVIVATIGVSAVGLVVDRVTSVIRATESSIGVVPAVLNRGAGDAQIDAIFRAGDGTHLVSILSPEHLFRDEATAHILADGYQREDDGLSDGGGGNTERFVIFMLGSETYGLPIAAVDEVVRLPDALTRLPRAPAFVDGVMNFRGRVIPLIDLHRRFDVADSPSTGRRRVLVTRIGDLQAGFIVDAVSEIADLQKERMTATPELPGDHTRVFDRVVELAGDRRVVLLVDPEAMLDRVEADLLRALKGSGTPSAVP